MHRGASVLGRVVLALLVLCATGCERLLYGAGQVYLWNGTGAVVQVEMSGKKQGTATLRPETGQLFEKVTAGPYTFALSRGGEKGDTLSVEVQDDLLSIVNIDGVGCFARANVIGMYQKGIEPIQVGEVYRGQKTIQQEGPIDIFPGQRLPQQAPRKPYSSLSFLRLVVVPCELLKGDPDEAREKVVQFLRRLR